MQEVRYKIINGFEDYIIFDNGIVLSKITKKILKPANCRGYDRYCLHKDKIQTMKFGHRLVAEAFIPNPNNLETVNHIDENKTNNSFKNLEWMTREDNMIYSYAKKVAMIKDGKIIKIFQSTQEAKRNGFSQSNIWKCCHGIFKQTGGYQWRYLTREEAEQALKCEVSNE